MLQNSTRLAFKEGLVRDTLCSLLKQMRITNNYDDKFVVRRRLLEQKVSEKSFQKKKKVFALGSATFLRGDQPE